MRSTTLTITLFLTAAALVSTAVLPSNPKLPRFLVGPSLTCNRINAQASSARRLSEITDTDTDTDTDIAAVPRLVLSARDSPDQYSPCGVLRGNERSASFTLDHKTRWNAFWSSQREAPGGPYFCLFPALPTTELLSIVFSLSLPFSPGAAPPSPTHTLTAIPFLASVALWQIGPNDFDVRVELAGMPRQQLRVPFRPQPGRQYAIELNYPGPSLFAFTEPVMSWYFATQ